MNKIIKKLKLSARTDQVRTGEIEFVFGEEGTDISKLRDPFHFSINPTKDFILFCNTYDNNLQIFTLGGDFITSFSDEKMDCVLDVLYTRDSIYVTGGSVPGLKQFTDFATRGVLFNANIADMWNPRGLTCDSEQKIYFIDEYGCHVVVFEKNLEGFHKIDISPHTDCVDIFIYMDRLFLLSQSPLRIIKLTLEGEFIFGINCSQFISFSHSFCPSGNESIILSNSHGNDALCVVKKEIFKCSLIILDLKIPKYLIFQRMAAIHNSRLILSTFDSCMSVIVT